MSGSGEHHRGLFHHKKDDSNDTVAVETSNDTVAVETTDDTVAVETTEVYASETLVDGKPYDSKVEIKKHATKEHIAEAGALLGGAFALYEKHQAKKDPENAHKHHIGESIAGAVAIGSGAFAVHEHHDKKDAEKEAKHHH